MSENLNEENESGLIRDKIALFIKKIIGEPCSGIKEIKLEDDKRYFETDVIKEDFAYRFRFDSGGRFLFLLKIES